MIWAPIALSLQARANFVLFVGLRGLRFEAKPPRLANNSAKFLPWALRSIAGALQHSEMWLFSSNENRADANLG